MELLLLKHIVFQLTVGHLGFHRWWLKSPTPLDFLWVTPKILCTFFLVQIHNTAEILSLIMCLKVIPDLWNHSSKLSSAILSNFQSWTGALWKYMDQSLDGCGCLMLYLLVTPNLTVSWCLRVSIYNGPEMHRHTQTHTHRNTSTCMEMHTCRAQGHNTNREHRCSSSWKCLCPAMWEMESLGPISCPFGIPFHFFPQTFSIILT